MLEDFFLIVLIKFSLSAGEIMIRFDFPYLISILSKEQAGEDKGLRVLLISLISCIGILCLKGPQEIFNWSSEISYPVPNQIHPMNRTIRIMMTNGSFADWMMAGIIPNNIKPQINIPNQTSRFVGKYIGFASL